MCGICGVFKPGGVEPEARALVLRMAGQLGHRGPDGAGLFADHEAVLGHTRLSILDLSGGWQPIGNEDGMVVVSFNGEIFNYLELRQELIARGHVFRTNSDTEVLVHLYEEEGTGMFARLNGQYAFAILDRVRGQLLLARDDAGILPLFYVERPGGELRFASEIKALLAAPDQTRQIAPEGLAQALTLWAPVAPRTAFAGVTLLPPGHHLVADRRGIRIAAHHQPRFAEAGPAPGPAQLDQQAEALYQQLTRAIRLRLRADVPVGAYLSGGIDSSVLATLLRREHGGALATFSLRFADQEFDEGSFQRVMSRRLGTDHHEVVVGAREIAEVFPQVVWHAEAPLPRTAPAPMFLLSALVRQSGYRVVLTGEGSDEMLGGYDLFREAKVRRFWARGGGSAWRARLLDRLYPWLLRNPAQAPAFSRLFFGRGLDRQHDPAFSHRPRWEGLQKTLLLLSPALKATLQGYAPEAEVLAMLPDDFASLTPLARAQLLEIRTLMQSYILAGQGDRMLMGNSVEGRFPFLDQEVMAFAHGLHPSLKLRGLREKYLLKRAFRADLPAEILERPKQPYRAPDGAPFFGADAPAWVGEVLGETSVQEAGLFAPAAVAALRRKFEDRRGAGMSQSDTVAMVSVLSAQLLHQQFVRDLPSRLLPDAEAREVTLPALARV